ncbi:MAG TPA: adenosine kinase [Caulobacteraceae bacterium]|nr:adenosine kinase [Caulobacteraceae bacterium]
MTAAYDVVAIGNAIVDVIAPATEAFLEGEGLQKGSMTLIDEARAASLYDGMAAGVEASGGSAGNTIAGIASFGGRAAYLGKVASDQLGEVFAHDLRAQGVAFDTPFLDCGPATGRCLINVTPDGQRTMATFLGAANQLTEEDVDPAVIQASAIVYMEGYLFDPAPARKAFARAAEIAKAAGRRIAITLSDVFVVERWRDDLLAFTEQSVDVVFANENELTALFRTDDFDAACERLRPMVEIAAVTRGEQGSVILNRGETHRIDAFPVDRVLDTTGAGDQYAAGFLYGLARGLPLPVCGRLGSMAAAEVIGHYGPRPQVSLKELAERHGLA